MGVHITKNGKKVYYYYKKKIGRPKKRGPKPKPKKRGRSWQQPWDFKLVLCEFKKQDRVIGYFHNLIEVSTAVDYLKQQNETVVLPTKYTIVRKNKGEDGKSRKFKEYDSEYVILERVKGSESSNTSRLRNEYGKIIEYTTTSKNWRIYDKFKRLKEETFWVYGYNPRTERKTFQWVYDELITDYLNYDSFLIIRICLYYNKVVIRYDADDLNFVICKNKSDAIRFYNKLKEIVDSGDKRKRRTSRIIFTGNVVNKTDTGRELVSQIHKKTGWDIKKIRETDTL